jgi:hypothetical protein
MRSPLRLKQRGLWDGQKRRLSMFWIIISIIIASIAFVSLKEGFVPISMCVIAIGTFIISLFWMNYLTSKSKKKGIEFFLVKKKIDKIEKGINELKPAPSGGHIPVEKLEKEIEELITLLNTLSEMVEEDDSLICKEIIDKNIIEKLTTLEKGIKDLNNDSHQFEKKKEELLEIIESLEGYIDLISTRLLPEDSLLLVEIEKNIKIIDEEIRNLKSNDNEKIKKEKTDKIIKLRDKKIEVLSKEPEGVLDKHEIRRSLTISLTIVYFMLLFFSIFSPVTTTTQFINMTGMSPENITGNITVGDVSFRVTEANISLSNTTTHTTTNLQSPFIEVFTYIYLAVIAFYFGSRAIETYITKKK